MTSQIPLDDATVAEAKRLKTLTGSTAANVFAVILLVLACWRGGVFDLCLEAARYYALCTEDATMKRDRLRSAPNGIKWNAATESWDILP